MQVQNLQTNNTAFKARVNVIGSKLDKKAMTALSEKAKNIGRENDVVEIKFSHLISSLARHSYFDKQDRSLINYMFVQYRQLYNARFLPNGKGKGLEILDDALYSLEYDDVWQKQEQVANNYLDRLVKKLGN